MAARLSYFTPMNVPPQPCAVALVGRPNVGKSALFNRLLGRRASIVHNEAGVTRDRVVGEAQWNGRPFPVIDTGGIGSMDRAKNDDEITRGAYQQVDLALEDAAAVIFVTDVQTGIHPLDIEVANRLRKRGRPVFLAANKADVTSHEPLAAEFEQLGFPVFAVSALHSRGLDDLMDRVCEGLPPYENPTLERPLTVAVVGRPNAGKSSFINRLLRTDRVIVSEVPGTTRDSVEIPFTLGTGTDARHYRLIDTAGLRAQKRLSSAVDAFSVARTEEAIRRADVVVWMLDAQEGPTRQDKRIADFILERHRGCVRAVNKWDLVRRRTTIQKYRAALDDALPYLAHAPACFLSALTGEGVRQTIDQVDDVAGQINTNLTTGVLNRTLRAAIERQPPPASRSRRLKLLYATQVSVRPIRLRLFVNDPALRTASYEQYLIHRLRDAFGLSGAPIVLQWRARSGDAQRTT
jgi:GTPase